MLGNGPGQLNVAGLPSEPYAATTGAKFKATGVSFMKTGKLETRPNPKQAVFRTSVNSNARDNAWYPINPLTKPLGAQPQFENKGVLAKVGLIVYEMFNSPWHLAAASTYSIPKKKASEVATGKSALHRFDIWKRTRTP